MNMVRDCKTRDRISNLPDSLLYHIHSFLHIKDVARTSVLSQRWKYIWTTVPTLDFWSQTFSLPNSWTDEFMDFVDGTLHRHLSNIDNFSIHWDIHLNESRVHSWISTAIRRNVKELKLYLNQDHPMFIPLSLFTCASLISLKLQTHPNVCLPKYISFPRLKRLQLFGFEISGESWNEELFSNSPALEELELHHCFYGIRNFCISIPTLKLLKIETWRDEDNGLRDCILKIHAPKLVTFSYRGSATKEFVLSSFPVLMEAAVDFTFEENGREEEISRLLRALSNVTCLTLDEKTLQAICSPYYVSKNLLIFLNVKMLKISENITTDQGLIELLKAVPNLESLVIEEYMNDELIEYSDEDDENNSDEDDSEESGGDGDESIEDDNTDSIDGENNHVNEDEGESADAEIIEYSDKDDENNSNEDDSEEAEGDGDDDNEDDNADSVEGKNRHVNEDEGDVADAAECEDNCVNENGSWSLDNVATGCLFPHLKSVRFQQFVGNPREMKWVELILKNAEALQMMAIHYCDNITKYIDSDYGFVDAKSEEEVMEEMPNIARASSGCVFKFCSWEPWARTRRFF